MSADEITIAGFCIHISSKARIGITCHLCEDVVEVTSDPSEIPFAVVMHMEECSARPNRPDAETKKPAPIGRPISPVSNATGGY